MANTVSVLQAARLLAEYAKSDKIADLTPLKLQKILYYVEGWHLGYDKVHDELFIEQPLAWRYGPVYRALYDRLRAQHLNVVKASDLKDVDPIDSKGLQRTIRIVWDAYKNKSARELVSLSHETIPYKTAYRNQVDDRISKIAMKEYFSRLAHES